MRCYECKCLDCSSITQVGYASAPYPEYGDCFQHFCKICEKETSFTRTMTRKAAKELKAKQAELDLRQTIIDQCNYYGFQNRFLYQSVIVTPPLADWCFDYHQPNITLYHESTYKINWETGDFAKAHVQFRNQPMKPSAVIDYIASHDEWRAQQNKLKRR